MVGSANMRRRDGWESQGLCAHSCSLFIINIEVHASKLELCRRHEEETHFSLFNISTFQGLWLNCVFLVEEC